VCVVYVNAVGHNEASFGEESASIGDPAPAPPTPPAAFPLASTAGN
jgi:hypothetical protein